MGAGCCQARSARATTRLPANAGVAPRARLVVMRWCIPLLCCDWQRVHDAINATCRKGLVRPEYLETPDDDKIAWACCITGVKSCTLH